MGEIKKNQHYVPQYYLKSWESPELFVLINDKVEKRNTKSIAREKHFYKLIELSKNDILFLRKFIEDMTDSYRKINQNWIDIYESLFNMIEVVRKSIPESKEREKIIKELIINSDEDLYSSIENDSKELFSILIDDKKINLSKNEKSMLCFTIAIQYFRTKRVKEAYLKSAFTARNDRLHLYNNDTKEFYSSLNFEAIWIVLSKILATNLGNSIFVESNKNHNIYLIKNKTELPFITCDQPCINLTASAEYNSNNAIPDEMNLYFPISPTLALFLPQNKVANFIIDIDDIDVNEVSMFNDRIAKHSLNQIYSNNKGVLNELIKRE